MFFKLWSSRQAYCCLSNLLFLDELPFEAKEVFTTNPELSLQIEESVLDDGNVCNNSGTRFKSFFASPRDFFTRARTASFIFYAWFLTTYQLVCNISFVFVFLSPETYHRLISFSPDTRVAFGR